LKKLRCALGILIFLGLTCPTDFISAKSEKEKQGATFEIGPVPSWVRPVNAPNEIEPGLQDVGVVYLLVDRQKNVGAKAFYYHGVEKITSEKGIQNATSVSISFYPAFHRLTFHALNVVHEGRSANRLDRSRIQVTANQKDPDQAIYDPSFVAKTVLEDVRVGDTVEISYTIEGENPLERDNYCSTYLLQWPQPIVRNYVRIIYPANRKLSVQPRNGAVEPRISTTDGNTELLYEARNVPGRKIEEDAPDDYSVRPALQISECQNWAEVARWAIPLFETRNVHSAAFDAEIAKLRNIVDPEARIVAALQFVEDEIRLTGKSWLGRHQPRKIDEVLRGRFADDKEKVVLLVALLRGIGADAAPALVGDLYRKMVRQRLPSWEILDQAIVEVRVGQTTHWLDPSRALQRGSLAQIYIAPFGYALVLRPDTIDLTQLEPPKGSWPSKKIVENYRVPKPEQDGEFEVISEYRGLAAERTRKYFHDNTREEIQKQYLDYYARSFPEVKTQKLVWYEELPGENGCRVTESYLIPKIWQLSDEKDRYTLFVEPEDIYSALGSTISPQRLDPLALYYPNHVIEEINIEMFEDWPLSSKGQTTTTDFFRLQDEPTATGSHIQLTYTYEALKDRVEPNEIPKFNETVNKAKDTIGYNFTYRTPAQIEANKSKAGFNWAVAAAALSFFVTATFAAYLYFRHSKLPEARPPPIDAPAQLNGIGGWLILLAIGQLLRPISYIKTGFDLYPSMMDIDSWGLLTDPSSSSYHPWWAPTLLFELFYNIVAFVFCVLLIALFFRKRNAWPRCFAIFLLLTIVANGVDSFLVDRIPAASESLFVSIRNIAGVGLTAAIWIPYLYLSKRVKATFRY
jgi:Protein of unknown function (DUF2569)/Domain of Unknown Function with PDB structure (DUF3857)